MATKSTHGTQSENRERVRIGRRQFIRRATAVGAMATGFPFVISSSALGFGGTTPPSNRITLGLIGMGKQMGGHLGTFLGMDDVQVLAVCDVEALRLEVARKTTDDSYAQKTSSGTYKGCSAFKDFRELCARPDIDAVVVATPNQWHSIPVITAAKEGKDVYAEKPMTETIEEGKAMVAAVRRYGRVFQQGSQQRSERGFRVACELVQNGRIGKVHTVHVNVGGPPVDCYLPAQPTPVGLDWDFWLGPAPYRPYNEDIAPAMDYKGWPNWRAYRDYAGGGMTDWGAHHFDIAQWGLGMDETGPVEIIPPNGKDVELLTYKYANGVTMYHGGGSGGNAGVEFIGDKGRVMVNRGYLETDPVHLRDEPIGPEEIHLYESDNHHRNWLDCIRTRKRPICDVEIGYHTVVVCLLGNLAYQLKRPLKWDPVKEDFVNDPQASRLLSRSMRAPWRLV
jgi:predicted dehydrogenase